MGAGVHYSMDETYWDNIYSKKQEQNVSWYQAVPAKSLELIAELELDSSASIIDVGGGDSRLVDHLLAKGFSNITILDISATALERANARLHKVAKTVKFIPADVTKFEPPERYKLWHDRATFHFLTKAKDVEAYLEIADRAIAPGGYLIVSTFSKTGPEKCSGLPVTQYADEDLKTLFVKRFTNIRCFDDIHVTPWNTPQSFVYCGFKKN